MRPVQAVRWPASRAGCARAAARPVRGGVLRQTGANRRRRAWTGRRGGCGAATAGRGRCRSRRVQRGCWCGGGAVIGRDCVLAGAVWRVLPAAGRLRLPGPGSTPAVPPALARRGDLAAAVSPTLFGVERAGRGGSRSALRCDDGQADHALAGGMQAQPAHRAVHAVHVDDDIVGLGAPATAASVRRGASLAAWKAACRAVSVAGSMPVRPKVRRIVASVDIAMVRECCGRPTARQRAQASQVSVVSGCIAGPASRRRVRSRPSGHRRRSASQCVVTDADESGHARQVLRLRHALAAAGCAGTPSGRRGCCGC